VIADERELAIARRPSAWRDPGGYHPPIINGHGRVRAIGPGERFDRFEETLDLFGDGSLRILRTPGHTMGHLSVLAQTDTGEILICGDAAHLQRQLDEILEMTIMQDAALFRDSLGRIQAYLRSNPQTVAIPGHDPQAWSSLPDVF
jgi:glyoxylase-like metal-dependent hydrolase (beta-lactamase superfamily II)